jgi:GST-like protein
MYSAVPVAHYMAQHFSAIDVYLGAVVHWPPGRARFEESCPNIAAVAGRVSSETRLASVWSSNFGKNEGG